MDPRYINPEDFGPPKSSNTSYTYSYEASVEPPNGPYQQEAFYSQHNGDPPADLASEYRIAPGDTTATTTTWTTANTLDRENATDIQKNVTETQRVILSAPAPPDRCSTAVASSAGYMNGCNGSQQNVEQSVEQSGVLGAMTRRGVSPVMGPDKEYISVYSVPSAPGAPHVFQVELDRVTLSWLRPDYDGDHGPIEGYIVECRLPTLGQPEWLPAHDGLIMGTEVTVCNLQPGGEYEFRIVAKNPGGFGQPSTASPLILLTSSVANGPASGPSPYYASDLHPVSSVPYPPGRPLITSLDSTSVSLSWEPPISSGEGGPVAGYHVEYRNVLSSDWLLANDYLVQDGRFTVQGLKPNGEYEFRILAKNSDGLSAPSQSSSPVRIHPLNGGSPRCGAGPASAPLSKSSPLAQPGHAVVPEPPSQPQVTEVDSESVTLIWAPGVPKEQLQKGSKRVHGYHVEYRVIGEGEWNAGNDCLLFDTQHKVCNLKPENAYEFRVFAMGTEAWSDPSEVTDIVHLKPIHQPSKGARTVPLRPKPPEIYNAEGRSVTLAWEPASSPLPVQGYQLEIRDITPVVPNGPLNTDAAVWQCMNQILTNQCQMTVADLEEHHVYEFRVVAKNSIGYSEPSPPSIPHGIGPETLVQAGLRDAPLQLGSETVLQQGQEPNGLLQHSPRQNGPDRSTNAVSPSIPEEFQVAHESPPITDTDDSPPPIRRHPPLNGNQGEDGVQWRDPTLPEVLDYLSYPNDAIKENAAGYLQHLTYHDNTVKKKATELGAIPKLVDILKSTGVPELQRNACGCLRNLSYGRENIDNKILIMNAGGVGVLSDLLRETPHVQVQEEITGVLWNLSSAEELKKPILDQSSGPLIDRVIIPFSGWSPRTRVAAPPGHGGSNPVVFRNAAGVLRNISSAGELARKRLREHEGFIEALIHYLQMQIERSQSEDKSVENVVCVLRNLSYRCQEVEDPEFDKHSPLLSSPLERSRSAPSGSPKLKAKKDKKGNKNAYTMSPHLNRPTDGMALLWQPSIVKHYLRLLQDCSNPETLEASAGAIQNLAACYWKPSEEIRTAVRVEKGLPILVELLRVDVDSVVCSAGTALRNLAVDPRNRELIGKYAMRNLVNKLPAANRPPDPSVSEETTTAILGVVFEVVGTAPEFARSFQQEGGTERLMWITRSKQLFRARVVKYASQVLCVLWRHRELHDAFKRSGYKESDFVTRTIGAGNTGTIGRPISNQGKERGRFKEKKKQQQTHPGYSSAPGSGRGGADPYESVRQPPNSSSRLRPDLGHPEVTNSADQPRYGSTGQTPEHLGLQNLSLNTSNNSFQEPLYAQVHKQGKSPVYTNANGSSRLNQPAGDSWV